MILLIENKKENKKVFNEALEELKNFTCVIYVLENALFNFYVIDIVSFSEKGLILKNLNNKELYINPKHEVKFKKTSNYFIYLMINTNTFEITNNYFSTFIIYHNNSIFSTYEPFIKIKFKKRDVNLKAIKSTITSTALINDIDTLKTKTFIKNYFRIPPGFKYSSSLQKTQSINFNLKNYPLLENIQGTLKLNIKKTTDKIGIFLSGGIDSLIILISLLNEGIKKENITCFSLLLSDNDDLKFEINIIKKIINYYKLKLITIENCNLKDNFISKQINKFEINYLANEASIKEIKSICMKHNIKYLYTGNGPDEMFTTNSMTIENLKTIFKTKTNKSLKFYVKTFFYFILLKRSSSFLYKKLCWKEILSIKNPDYFDYETKTISKKQMNEFNKNLYATKKLKTFPKREIYNSVLPQPRYFSCTNDFVYEIHPYFSPFLLKYILSMSDEKILTTDLSNKYHNTKPLLWSEFNNVIPSFMKNKLQKTNYNSMAKQNFLNYLSNIKNLFNEDGYIFDYELVKRKKFINNFLKIVCFTSTESAEVGNNFLLIKGCLIIENWLKKMSEDFNEK